MKKILISLNSNSLGDTIGVMPCIEKFISHTSDLVYLKSNPRFNSLFTKSYPMVNFYEEGISFDKTINIESKKNLFI